MGIFGFLKPKKNENKSSNFLNIYDQMVKEKIEATDPLYTVYRVFNIAVDTANYKGNTTFNDQHYFELLCYLITRIDVFLFVTKKQYREDTTQPLATTVCKMFINAFPNAADIFNDRMSLYGKMFQEKKDLSEIHNILLELLRRANNMNGLKIYSPTITLQGIDVDFNLKNKLTYMETVKVKEILEDFN